MGKSHAASNAALRGRKLVVLVVTTAVLVGPFATGGHALDRKVPPCSIPGQIEPHIPPELLKELAEDFSPEAAEALPHWYTVKDPTFPVGPQIVTDYAVEPLVTERMYVTNGTVVMRSSDSGCHWSQAYALPAGGQGMTAANSRILEIEVAAPGNVYLPVQQNTPSSQPHVVVSRDGGVSWASADGPLLASITGRLLDFDASLGNGAAAVMLVDVQAAEPGAVSIQSGQIVLATDSAGAAWEPRHFNEAGIGVSTPVGGVTVVGGEPHQYIAMNPVRPNEVWLYGPGGLYLSAGPTGPTAANVGPTSLLDISLDGDTVIAYGPDPAEANISFDGGQTFDDFNSLLPVDSVDMAYGAPALSAVGAQGGVFFQQIGPGQKRPVLRDVSPVDGRAVRDITIGMTGGGELPTIFARSPGAIEVLYQPELPEAVLEVTKLKDLVPREYVPSANYLEPHSKEIWMRPGDTRTVDYLLNVPPESTPLDVYFMIDISSSMDNAINGVRSAMQDIVDRLYNLDINVHFGVGSFRAYDDPPAYERNRDIGPVDGELTDALNGLRSAGGGTETQMAALLQSVTGAGDYNIPEGLNMHFRTRSLRVAIEVTDEPISQGGQHPSYDTVIAGLLEHDVKMVGLAVQDPGLLGDHNYENPGGGPASGLQRVATGSGAVAPADGVDCDGDQSPEIQPGGPIVCMIAPSRSSEAGLMADAIVSVLRAIQDIQDLEVRVSPSGVTTTDSPLVESIAPQGFLGVDMKQPVVQTFSVTVRCPRVTTKNRYPLDVSVGGDRGALARASLQVTCVPRPVEPEPILPLPLFVPVAVVPPPPPRPPDPIPEPNPNPNPNPQQNPQAQAGFAAQEQRQPQLAVAHQVPPVEDAAAEGVRIDDFRMTAHDEQSRIPPVGFIFTAGGITALYAYAALVRGNPRLAHARNRRARRR